jgi:hypothetical protein
MVEVFKTNVDDKLNADNIIEELSKIFPSGIINFDLDDCDKILRVENENIIPQKVNEVLIAKGFRCEVLD